MNTNQPPLIVHVIHHLVIGGMENGLVNLINRMPTSAFRHAIICIEDYSDFRQRITRPDVEVIALHRSRMSLWQMRFKLWQLFRSLQPSIVHTRGLSGLDALLPAWLAGVPVRIHGEHGRDVNDLHGTNKKLALLRALHSPLISRYITVSRDLQQYLIERVHIHPKRITQIYNGVNTERFAPATSKPQQLLPPEFTASGHLLVGTVGRLQAVKSQATLIKAFALFVQQNPQLAERVNLAIIGDGRLMEELRQLTDTLGLNAKTCFPGSFDNVAEVLRTLDVFVLPSQAEGISNTILEAMASGLPVIATNVGGNPELVDDQQTGFLVPADDPQAMADKIRVYVANPALTQQHGQQGLQQVQQRFSLTAMVASYQAVYQELLERRTSARQ